MIIPLLTALALTLAPADDEILQEGREALISLEGARALAQRSIERAELEGGQLAELLETVSASLPEAPPEIETYPDEGHDGLKARFESWRDHLALLEERVDAPLQGRERKATQTERFDELVAAGAALTASADAFDIAFAAVVRLVTEAEVTAEEAATALGLEQVSQGTTKLEEARAFAAALPERIAAVREAEDAIIAALSAIEAPPTELLAEATIQRDAGEILMSTLVLENGERDDLAKREQAGIQAALDRALVDWSAMAELEKLKVEAREDWEGLQALDRVRTARTPPSREDFAEGEGHAELREARRELAWAEAMLAYRQETVEFLESGRITLNSLQERLIVGGELVRSAGSALIRIRSAVKARAMLDDPSGEQPIVYPEIEGQNIWETLKSVLLTEARRTFVQEEVARRLADTDPAQTASRALEAQTEVVERARRVLLEEEAYATLVEEMGRLADEALLAQLDPQGSAFAALQESRREEEVRRRLLAEVEAKLPGIVARVTSLDTPYAQKQITSYPDRGEEIRKELADLMGREEGFLPTDTSELEERWDAISGARSRSVEPVVEGIEEELLSPSRAELSALRLIQRAAQARLRYFIDLDALVAELQAASDEYEASIDAVGEALAMRLSLERRLFAASREVARRRRKGLLPDARVPEGLVPALPREEIEALVGARKTLDKATDDKRALLRNELERQALFLSWKQWAEIGGEVAQQNNNLISQPVKHVESARRAVEDLKEFERGNLEYTAQQRALDERSRATKILAALAKPKRRERFEATLNAFYLELVNLERVMGEYTKAQKAYQQLIEINQRYREGLTGAVEAMRQVELMRQVEYQEVRAFAGIAANPTRRIRISADFSQMQGRELPAIIDDRGWNRFLWADALVSAEARLWGDRAWIAALELRLSRVGIESDINAFRAHIAHIGAEIEEGEELRRELQVRIGELRASYSDELFDNALWTLLKILLIPILAILTVRGLTHAAGRLRSKARGEVGSPGRKRRLETLTNVTTASIRVVVWIIAGIYVLGFLGLDITPIIASASVLGLAVAFGAQALVKDFFAGFFMLLEHQYSVGDVVDLGVASGTVEHISLRMTILRDLEGTVHHVPNGLVQRVANKTKGWSRIVMEVGVPYGEDVDRVTEVLREVLEEVWKDEQLSKLIIDEPTVAGVQALGESRIDLRLMVKVEPGEQWGLARELRSRIKRRFDAEGIKAPYPQRVIHQLAE